MELFTRREVCSFQAKKGDHVCKSNCECVSSDLGVFDQSQLISRMISAVNVATSYREPQSIAFVGASDRHSRVTPETVARKFRCGLETAQRTLKATTQRGVRQSIHPLHRRYRVDHLHLHQHRLKDTFYMDTLFSKVKSLAGYTCAQVITNGTYTRVYPMESEASLNIANALSEFFDDVGIPETLICDLASEQTGKKTEVMKLVRRHNIRMLPAEKSRGITQNSKAESEIREVKTKWKVRMRECQVPSRLWDYGLVYISEIQSLIARGPTQRSGLKLLTGQTPDTSEWLDFDFFDRVWYWDQKKMDMTDEQARVGRWLGIAHRVGSDMTYWILTEAGTVIARSTVQHITVPDMATDAMKARVHTFDENLLTRLNDENFQLDLPGHVFYSQDDDDDSPFSVDNIPTASEYGDMVQAPKLEADEIEYETFDPYLGAEFLVNNNGESVPAKVVKRARDNDGKIIGKQNANPLLDSREYDCVLDDGTLYRYSANVIAENIFAQCDDEGRRQAVLQEITDHKKDASAVDITRGYVMTRGGSKIPKKTTKGWKLLCTWKDGSSDWIELRHIKDSNPIELAEYAVANRIQEEPAFKWWVSDTLRTRNRIIAKVKSRYWKTSHKYGVRLPHSVQEAL